ncbi:S-layer homology domain-containing protein [Arthrobacter sp. SPG23]|uniref:S-layer homology domain-containing protein n=1 Tax=Arthrobacter sp. SPG23 TaxID=1610703 RepID=UPI001F26D195|nr:S-layer homology domain-containing protein [Arthrobacter sp. SPG23]
MVVGVPGPLTASPDGYWVSATFPPAGNSRFTPSLAVDSAGSKIYVPHLLYMNPGNVTVQDAATGAVEATIPGAMGTLGVVLSEDGTRLYIANSGNTQNPRNQGTGPGIVQVVDTRTNTVTASIETDRGGGRLTLSPDGRTLFGAMYEGRNVTFIDTASNAITAKVPVPGQPGGRVAVSPDGGTLYVGDSYAGGINVVSVAERRVVKVIETGCTANSDLTLNPSGSRLYITGCVYPGTLGIVDTATMASHTIPLTGAPSAVAFGLDGNTAYVVDGSEAGRVLVLNVATETVTAAFPVGRSPQGIVINRDGSALWVVHKGSGVSRVDLVENGWQAFTDVPVGAPFFHEISWLGNSRISTGFPDGSFRQLEPVQRDAAAAFFYRLAGSPSWFVPPAVSPFRDLAPGDRFYKEITWLASQRITTGYDDGTFRPGTPVTREAMAAFLYRYATTQAGAPAYAAPATAPFSDVRPGDAFHREISWAAAAGITNGYGDGTFRPSTPVLREATAAFLYRLTNPDRPMPR